MKRVVAEKELAEYRGKCVEEVKKYERVVSYGIAESEKRTEQMWSKCKALGQSSEELKNIITNLHNRINRLENVLGFYSGAEIVSNY
jgi:predicted RNase H-like nuclease (RuvC/YqgF family)